MTWELLADCHAAKKREEILGCSSWEEVDPRVHCQAFTLEGANALTPLKEGKYL